MKLKTLLSLTFVLLLSLIFVIGIAAEDTLWAAKPEGEPLHSGYVVNGKDGHNGTKTDGTDCTGTLDSHAVTNIKWEVYNEGTDSAPAYALYFSIDDKEYTEEFPYDVSYKGNTILYAYTYLATNTTPIHSNGYAGTACGDRNPWVANASDIKNFKKIVIGDGITELQGGTFVGMHSVTIVEMPASLVKFNGTPFKGCAALKSVYTRGQTAEDGVFNLTNIKTFAQANYLFSNCESVEQYIFASDAVMSGLHYSEFYNNKSLKSITLPEGIKMIRRTVFNYCGALESVVFPSTLQSVEYKSFVNCTSLKSVTFKSDATVMYDANAVTKDDVVADNTLNAFATCTALSEIVAPVGSNLAEFALKYGFASLLTLKPTEGLLASGYVVNGKDGHTGKTDGTDCTGTLDSHAVTNIKWEVYNEGTDSTPAYALYFFIDDKEYTDECPYDAAYKDNTVIYAYTFLSTSYTAVHSNDYGGTKGGERNPWIADTGLDVSKFNKIVIGEGITELQGGTFVGMNKVTVIEMPTSLVKFNGTPFKGCAALKSVYTRGQTAEDGVFNLTNIKTFAQANYLFSNCESVEQYIFASDAVMSGLHYSEFYNNKSLKSITLPEGIKMIRRTVFNYCGALESIVFPSTLQSVEYQSFVNCTSLKSVTFNSEVTLMYDANAETKEDVIVNNNLNSFATCTALETINAPIGSTAHAFATKFGFNTSHTSEIYNGDIHLCTMTYHPDSQKITVESCYSSFWEWRLTNADVRTFINTYKDLAKHIVFTGYFGKIHPASNVDGTIYTAFEGAENLISVCFPKNARVLDFASYGRAFAGCTSLTTVYFGDEADMKMGVADFSGMNCNRDDYPTNFTKGLFENCGEITTVILPALENTTNNAGTIQNNPTIYANTFAGCSKLVSLDIPETFEVIEDGAFKDCTALTTINMFAPAEIITAGTFEGSNNGLVIKCQSYADAEAINSALAEGGVEASSAYAFYKSGMSIAGYQVRTTGYNGLRTIFNFYDKAYPSYKLVECGSIVATVANYEKYEESYGGENSILKLADGKFVTPANNVVKTAVYSGGEFVNNYAETDTGFNFSVTVTNFADEDQYKAEIINCGYEIWEKEDGSYLVVFERETAVGYESNSLYKTTLGMLYGGAVTLEKGSNPLYNVLMDCTYTTFAPVENVEGYLFADPLYSGKNVAVYLTDSASEIALEDAGFGASEADTVSRVICGKNVKFNLPEIDGYWLEHINEKLGNIPEGKSFIAYTDTHFESSGHRNTKKIAALVKYVKMLTGIDTVINLGDPYSGEPTIEESKEMLKISTKDYFYDVFGEDGLFAVGNHDSNITTWTTLDYGDVDEGVDGYYASDYLVPDSYIYEVTVKNIADKKDVVFDEAMLALVDDIEFTAVGSADSIYGVEYTPEQMKAEFLAWAKMHYYYDDAENGIRYIVINTGSCSVTEYYTLGHTMWNNVLPTQYDFIYNALNTVPKDENGEYYDIVFAGHQMASNTEGSLAQEKLYKILSAFRGGYKVEMTASHSNKNMQTLIGDTNKVYDFTEKAYDGTIFTVGGHWHLDLSSYYGTDGTYNGNVAYTYGDAVSEDAVFFIGMNNDVIETYTNANDVSMTKGDHTEDCFSVITITPEGEIVLTRFGAGEDRKFSYTNTIQ